MGAPQNEASQANGRKIHPSLENPIDNVFIATADAVMPLFRATGHTPNALTAYSGLAAALAVWQLYRGNLVPFGIAWLAAHWFDCADGHFARTYGMETELGDMLDHIKDALAMLALVLVVVYKYPPPWWAVVLGVVFGLLSMVHLGCQQKHYALHLGGNSGESLDRLQALCPWDDAESALRLTRYVGVGTLQVLLVVIVCILVRRQR